MEPKNKASKPEASPNNQSNLIHLDTDYHGFHQQLPEYDPEPESEPIFTMLFITLSVSACVLLWANAFKWYYSKY